MNPFFHVRDCFSRALTRKKTLIVFLLLFLAGIVLGLIFITTPAIYDYHLTICDRFVNRVCFSDRSVFEIFLERLFGNGLLLLLTVAAGIHWAGCIFPPIVLGYRAYTFGGSLYIFFSVYRISGAFIVVALYLPVHILVDAVLCCASTLSYARAPHFGFAKPDWLSLLTDLGCLFLLLIAIGLIELLLLMALFHPLGNIF